MNSSISHSGVDSTSIHTTRLRLEGAINSLLGLIEGISIDSSINPTEVDFLRSWLAEHADVAERHPFNELVPLVTASIADGRLSEEERLDIHWLCERLRSTNFTSSTGADLQRLSALVGGIAADGLVNEEEVRRLGEWLQCHQSLRTCWPYDEIVALVSHVLRDGKIDSDEKATLESFFAEFAAGLDDGPPNDVDAAHSQTLIGVCAVCPEISFQGSLFCFVGASKQFSHDDFHDLVSRLGGRSTTALTANVDYLVVGAEGNPCWSFACYGRTVERAIELRKSGARLALVHEFDFNDAVADSRSN